MFVAKQGREVRTWDDSGGTVHGKELVKVAVCIFGRGGIHGDLHAYVAWGM